MKTGIVYSDRMNSVIVDFQAECGVNETLDYYALA